MSVMSIKSIKSSSSQSLEHKFLFKTDEPCKLAEDFLQKARHDFENLTYTKKSRIGVGPDPDYEIKFNETYFARIYISTRCDIELFKNLPDGCFQTVKSIMTLDTKNYDNYNYVTADTCINLLKK